MNRPQKKRDFCSKSRTGDESWVYGYHTGTQQVIPLEVMLLPYKRVETDEVRLQEHVVHFLEQRGNSSGVFFFSASL